MSLDNLGIKRPDFLPATAVKSGAKRLSPNPSAKGLDSSVGGGHAFRNADTNIDSDLSNIQIPGTLSSTKKKKGKKGAVKAKKQDYPTFGKPENGESPLLSNDQSGAFSGDFGKLSDNATSLRAGPSD